ncbi:MAG TPA: hypothetical protein VHU43_01480, partial [Steroidobacteraceae bacterium]|nr:hypothetical protein [Steroidobacteraceae bacterium]
YLKQQETLFGILSKQDVASVKQVMSTAFNEGTVAGSALTLTLKEPIWSQLVKITSPVHAAGIDN